MSEEVVAPAAVPVPPTETPVKPQTSEVEVDDSEEYVVDGKKIRLSKLQRTQYLQKAAAADKRLQEAAEKSKAVDEWVELLDKDFDEAMRKRGKDPEKLIAERLKRRAEAELLTPEQREKQRIEQERDAYKRKLEEREQQEQKARQAELDQRHFMALEQQIIEAANELGVDSSPEVLAGIADIAIEHIKYGSVPTARQVVKEYVRQEREAIEARDRKLLGKLKGKDLLKYLGDVNLKEIRAALALADSESLKAVPVPESKSVKPKPVVVKRNEKGRYISETDFDGKFAKK